MNEIVQNARRPLTDMADKLHSSATMINYRIKKLIKLGVIQGFRTEINISKLGYHVFKVYIFLKEFKHRSEIINYIKFNPNLVCIDTTTGESHLELDFYLENISQIYQIMQDFIKKFPSVIRNYESASLIRCRKYRYIPEFQKIKGSKRRDSLKNLFTKYQPQTREHLRMILNGSKKQ